jgi:hypothetical protein
MTLDQLKLEFEELKAKQQLHELVTRYCVGVDRRDGELLSSLWVADSHIDFGVFKGTGQDFANVITTPNPVVEIMFHFTSNELFTIAGNTAEGRHYVIGMTSVNIDGTKTQSMVGGRYLDKYARAQGVWKFTERLFVMDWNKNDVSTENWTDGIGAVVARGRLDGEDPSHTFFNSLSSTTTGYTR